VKSRRETKAWRCCGGLTSGSVEDVKDDEIDKARVLCHYFGNKTIIKRQKNDIAENFHSTIYVNRARSTRDTQGGRGEAGLSLAPVN